MNKKDFFKLVTPPDTYEGRKLVETEVFITPKVKETLEEALYLLEAIRRGRPPQCGWVELWAGIEQVKGGYVAMRYQARYE